VAKTPAPKSKARGRPLGLLKGRLWIAEDFDAPLPDDMIDAMEGKFDAPWQDDLAPSDAPTSAPVPHHSKGEG